MGKVFGKLCYWLEKIMSSVAPLSFQEGVSREQNGAFQPLRP